MSHSSFPGRKYFTMDMKLNMPVMKNVLEGRADCSTLDNTLMYSIVLNHSSKYLFFTLNKHIENSCWIFIINSSRLTSREFTRILRKKPFIMQSTSFL